MRRTFVACGPFWPSVASNSTFAPSVRDLKPSPAMPLKCTNRSFDPSSGVMKPYPFSSLNHFTVPVAMNSPPPALPTGPPPAPARVHELRPSTAHSRALELFAVPEPGSDATDVALLLGKDKSAAPPGAAGPAGPPHAVHVALVVLGRVGVDDL